MSNQWKIVPVEPTEEMLKAGDAEVKPDLMWPAMLAAAPVTPAGDVEVLEVYGYQCRQSAQEKFFLHEYPHYWQHIPLVRQADAMERITRLTAENDAIRLQAGGMQMTIDELTAKRNGLLAEVERQQKTIDGMNQIHADSVAYFQSELTKARELLECLMRHPEVVAVITRPTQKAIREALATPIAHNVDESCGQDAEAANTVNGLTDAEWQDRDDQDRQELERD